MTHIPDTMLERCIFLSGSLQKCPWQLFLLLPDAGKCFVRVMQVNLEQNPDVKIASQCINTHTVKI